MLKDEFLKLTGISEISNEEYHRIEVVYEELGAKVNKEDFCAMYKSLDFARLFEWCKQLARTKRLVANDRDLWQDYARQAAKDIILGNVEASKDDAYDILSTADAIRLKIANGKTGLLDMTDYEYIKNNL